MTTELLAGRIDVTFATLPSVIGYIDAGVAARARGRERKARRAAAERADARGGRHRRRRGRRLVRAVRAGEDAGRGDRAALRAVAAALEHRGRAKAIAAQGMTLALRPPAEIAAWLPGEVAKWAAVIKAAGVVVE